jgi:hypothetical protein
MPSTYEEKLAAWEKRRRASWESWYAWSRGRPGYEIRAEAERHSLLQLPGKLTRTELVDVLVESEVGRPPRRPIN